MNNVVNRSAFSSLADLADALEPSSCPYTDDILSYAGLKSGRKFTKQQLVRLHQAMSALVVVRGLVHKGLMEQVLSENGDRGYQVTTKGRAVWAHLSRARKPRSPTRSG